MNKQILIDQMEEYKLNFLEDFELINRLAIINKMGKADVELLVSALIKDGDIIRAKRTKLASIKHLGYVKGKISGNSRGFGFCVPLNSEIEDIFIPAKKLGTAMDGDLVVVKAMKNKNHKSKKGDSLEGEVITVVKRGKRRVVGTIQMLKTYAFVIPNSKRFSKDIFIPGAKTLNANDNDTVVVEIEEYSKRRPEGKVIEILKSANPAELDVLSIIRDYDLIEEFTENIIKAAHAVNKPITEKDIKGRDDLRKETIITIDGDDAKDLDDAISISKNADGTYKLGVHIADVGHYVKRDSVLDREAFFRGTSAYFPNMVLPMLPRDLSNGICSLNPKVDRLTLSCFMDIDEKGNVKNYRISESIINSSERMTYKGATGVLEGNEELCKKYADIKDDLELMAELAKILEKSRARRGALDLDLPECKIIVDPKTLEVKKLTKRERKESHKLIESFMLVANETVAKHMLDKEMPFVYRVHDKPAPEKVTNFSNFVSAFGLTLKGDPENLNPKDLQKFLKQIEKLEYKDVINNVMLRSMQKAKYKPECKGHFGLAAKYYTHFTSPIRRYPDLTIHRILKDDINGRITDKEKIALDIFVEESSLQSSEREVLAERAERDVDDYFKCRYMEDKIGNKYDALVDGVTSFGLYVELENTVQGFIPVEKLPGAGYNFLEESYKLAGKAKIFSLGDKLKVKLENVDRNARKIEFSLVEEEKEAQ